MRLRLRRALLLATHRLRLLEEMISVMNFLQSIHTSMVTQSSVSSLGSSSSSCDWPSLLLLLLCLDILGRKKKKIQKNQIRAGYLKYVLAKYYSIILVATPP